jgi:hypothetical protein
MPKTKLSLTLLALAACLVVTPSLQAQSGPAAPVLAPTQAYSTFHPYEVIRFNWSAVAGASTYVLQASADPSFPAGTTIKFDNIPSPSFSFAIGNPEGNYSARVFAIDANGVSSAASNVITFSVFFNNPVGPPPTLASPASGATQTLPITLTWNHVPNPQPSGYELQIARDSNFSSIEDDSPQLNGPSRTVLSLSAGTKFWRVRSFQGSASPTTSAPTAWSASRSFVVPSGPPRPVSITVTKDPMFPGESAMAQVQLTNAVGSSGAAVSITSSNPSILPVPATLTMPANTAWAQFMVTASEQVSDTTPVTLTATINSATTSQVVSIQPASLKSLQMSPGVLAGGDWTTVWIDLNGAAPAGGAAVTLTSDSPAAVPPSTVTVPAGFFSGSAWVQTNTVATATTATLSGTYKGASARTTLSLKARRPPTALTLSPSSTTNGSVGTVRVASSAGYDEWFPIATSNGSVASVSGGGVYLRAGMTSANFQIATTAVSASTQVTISTTNGGATQAATLTVNPSGAATPTLSSFTVSPTSVTGGTSATGTVRLSATAPSGGTVVSLGSNLPNTASVPPSVTVPAGATSATFTITTFPADTTTVQLSAGISSSFLFAALTVSGGTTSPPPSSTGGPYTLSVSASGRSGDRVTSTPSGISVNTGSTGSASFAGNTTITLSVASGRDAIWSGACTSGGAKRRSCSFTLTKNASVTANVQ